MIDAALANLKELGHKAIQKQSQAADVVRRHIKHLKEALEHTGREDRTIGKANLEQNVITTQTEAEENIASAQAAILVVNEEVCGFQFCFSIAVYSFFPMVRIETLTVQPIATIQDCQNKPANSAVHWLL